MLSGVIIAWNEEAHLARALASIQPVVDEIVVVIDAATTDKSPQIARSFTPRIFTHPHVGYVEPMRNFAISQARGKWILLLDADEEIPPTLAARIPQLLTSPSVDYFRLPRKNMIFNRWITSDHWWPDYVHRLFKKGSLTWSDTIHSQPQTHGLGQDLPPEEALSLIHHNYSTITQYLEQIDRYTTHQLNTQTHFVWTDLLNRPVAEFLRQYFARRGYQDGLHGLALALLQAFSEFVLSLKAWEQASFPPQPITPSQLDSVVTNLRYEYRWWSSHPLLRPWLKLLHQLGL